MSGTKGIHIAIPQRRIERDPLAVYADINEAWVTLEDLYIELGRALSEARRARGLSQTDVGERIGISHTMVALIELGRRWKHDSPCIERMAQLLSDER